MTRGGLRHIRRTNDRLASARRRTRPGSGIHLLEFHEPMGFEVAHRHLTNQHRPLQRKDGPHDALAPYGPSSTSTTSHHSRCMTRPLWQFPIAGRALAPHLFPEPSIRAIDEPAPDCPLQPHSDCSVRTGVISPRMTFSSGPTSFHLSPLPSEPIFLHAPAFPGDPPPPTSTCLRQGPRTCGWSGDFLVVV